MKKMFIKAMEYYTAKKRNEILTYVTKWMQLDIIMLSEIGKSPKTEILFFLFVAATVYRQDKNYVNVSSFGIQV